MSIRTVKGAGLATAMLLCSIIAAGAQTKTQPDKAAAPAASATIAAGDMAAAQAAFGFRLLQRAADQPSPPASVVVAPASVEAAFAFLDLGADPAMHAAIVKAFGFEAANGTAAMESLRSSAKGLSAVPAGGSPLSFSNAIFVDPAGGVEPAGLEKLTVAGITARVEHLGTTAGIDAINAWVSQQTAGSIPTILENPIPGAALVALNALHFKDDWQTAFDKGSTKPRPFHLQNGTSVDVPTMALRPTELAFRQDDRFIAVMLPYQSSGFDLVVLTTKDKPAAVGEFAPVATWLAGSGFAETQGSVALPKFDASASVHLLGYLDDFGLAEGKSPTAFSGLSKGALAITDVIQKTLIKVDEAGTEAAAATAVTVTRALRVADVVEMQVDKPFLFALRDEKNGLILLSGYVGDPTVQ